MNKEDVEIHRDNKPKVITRKNKPEMFGTIVELDTDCLNNSTGVLVLENLNTIEYKDRIEKKDLTARSLLTLVLYEEIINIKPQR
jgi:hypothetical protein